jgi:signal transduction histidine kinase
LTRNNFIIIIILLDALEAEQAVEVRLSKVCMEALAAKVVKLRKEAKQNAKMAAAAEKTVVLQEEEMAEIARQLKAAIQQKIEEKG